MGSTVGNFSTFFWRKNRIQYHLCVPWGQSPQRCKTSTSITSFADNRMAPWCDHLTTMSFCRRPNKHHSSITAQPYSTSYTGFKAVWCLVTFKNGQSYQELFKVDTGGSPAPWSLILQLWNHTAWKINTTLSIFNVVFPYFLIMHILIHSQCRVFPHLVVQVIITGLIILTSYFQ